jgi:hypothetical protein
MDKLLATDHKEQIDILKCTETASLWNVYFIHIMAIKEKNK